MSLKVAWAALRGRPVMYRMMLRYGDIYYADGHGKALVTDCTFGDSALICGVPAREVDTTIRTRITPPEEWR